MLAATAFQYGGLHLSISRWMGRKRMVIEEEGNCLAIVPPTYNRESRVEI